MHGSRFSGLCTTGLAALLASVAPAQSITTVTQATNDLVYDAATGKIFASVPASAGVNGNSVTTIDPVTLATGPFVFVGEEPGPLALSDDGEYLYVGLEGAGSVRRYHVPSGTADILINLGSDSFFGPYYAEDLVVQPGNNAVFAVSRKLQNISPRHGGVAVFDGLVQRPMTTPGHTGANRIEWSSDPSTIYGYNNETSEFGFRTLQVSASGVETSNTAFTAISGYDLDIVFHEGVVYSTSGVALDPVTGATLGTYSGFFVATSVLPDAAANRVYFLQDGAIYDLIHVYDLTTFTYLTSISVPDLSGTPHDLIRWGEDGLAFRTDAGQVALVSEVPPKRLTLSPGTGTFLTVQDFDLALIVGSRGTKLERILGAFCDNVDIRESLRASSVLGVLSSGEQALLCRGVGKALAERFGAGLHTLRITVLFADGTTADSTVHWTFLSGVGAPSKAMPPTLSR